MKDIIELKELKDYFIDNDITKVYSTISFRKFFFFLKIYMVRDFHITEEFKGENNPVKKIFEYYKKITYRDMETEDYTELKESTSLANKNLFGIKFYRRIKLDKAEGDNNLTIIQCPCKFNIKKSQKFFKTDFLIFPHPEATKKIYHDFINELEEENLRTYRFDYVEKLNKIFTVKPKKRDNVLVKLSLFNSIHISYSISYLKFPEFFTTTVYGLNSLRKGGNLFIGLYHTKLTPAYEKFFELLLSCFNTYYYEPANFAINYGSIMTLVGFKDNISSEMMKKLIKISLETTKYDYKVYDYYVYLNDHKEISYYLEDFKINVPVKEIMIIDDIDLETKQTSKSKDVLKKMESYFHSQINLTNTYINSYIYMKNNILKAEVELFKDLAYFRVVSRINDLYYDDIPVNKALLSYIGKFNKENITRLLTYKNSRKKFIFELENTISNKPLFNLSDFEIYSYDSFDAQQKIIKDDNELRDRYLKNINNSMIKNVENEKGVRKKIQKDELRKIKEFQNLNHIFEEFKKGLPNYINDKLRLDYPITNCFTKFWEIYTKFSFLIKNGKEMKSFHFGKHSEEVIYSTEYKIKSDKKQINYLWKTNKREGQINLLTQETKDRYIETDKIFNTYLNLKFYEEKLRENSFDLITCDEIDDSDNLTKIQKLEFSKLMMVLLTGSKNCNCVIRHLLPLQMDIEQSTRSSGFFINIVYIYQMYFEKVYFFKPVSTSTVKPEIYIIGKNFKGLKEYNKPIEIIESKDMLDMREEIDVLYNVVKYFKRNCCVYEKISLDEDFVEQIYEKIKILYDSISEELQTEYILLTCINTSDPIIRENTSCVEIFSDNYRKKNQINKFKSWLEEFKLK